MTLPDRVSTPLADRPLLLIVEDDEPLRRRLARALADRGFSVAEAACVATARTFAATEPPEFVLLDLRVEDGSSLDLITELKTIDPATRIVVLTGYGSIATAIEALKRGAIHYLTKPADADEILAAFERGSGVSAPPSDLFQPMSLARVEWEYINRVLVACNGNLSEAARTLGLHRRSLQRKLAKYPVRT